MMFVCIGILSAIHKSDCLKVFGIHLKEIVEISIIAFCAVLGSITVGYLQIYTIMYFSVLITIYLLDCNYMYRFNRISKNADIFYIVLSLIILSNILFSALNHTNISFIDEDTNYSGVFIFLYFMYSDKRKKKLGIILGILYGVIFTRSRSYILLMGLFYLIKLGKRFFVKIAAKLKMNNILFFLLLITLGTIILSYLWVYVIAASGQSAYGESLNDRSNFIRFVANIKFCDIIREPNQLLFGGYGKKLREFLQVDEFSNESTKFYLGARLVQPHNSVFNLVLRIGIIPSFIYLIVMSKFISRHMEEDNYEYIFPYMVNAMFMHSLFSLKWFAFWAFIILIPKAKDGFQHHCYIKKS